MSSGQMQEFEGLILYQKAYRENDLLVKLLTRSFGKKMFFIKGGNKPNFKLKSAILPFTHATYIGTINTDGLSFISAAKFFDQYQTINQDIYLNAYASYLLSLIDAVFKDNQSIAYWFDKIQQALNLIDEGFDAQIITHIIEIQLLGEFGVAQHLTDCVICGRKDLPFDFSINYGGILCQNHWHLDHYRLHLPAKIVYYLRLFSVIDLFRINSIKINPENKAQLKKVIDQIYQENVGLNLKTKQFINKMARFDDAIKPLKKIDRTPKDN